jgi:hypothetical protein
VIIFVIFVKGGVSTPPCLLEPQVSTTTLPIKCLLEGREYSNLNSSNIVFQRTGKEMVHGCLLRQIQSTATSRECCWIQNSGPVHLEQRDLNSNSPDNHAACPTEKTSKASKASPKSCDYNSRDEVSRNALR